MAQITGFVRLENGDPALGAFVQAFDKDMRTEELLGETVLEETSGRYTISYTRSQHARVKMLLSGLDRLFDVQRAHHPILGGADRQVDEPGLAYSDG